MSTQAMWDCEDPITQLVTFNDKLAVPRWIEQDISPSQVAAILQGGCASGAYMLAVTYWDALRIMGNHGDAVLEYIEEQLGFAELPQPKAIESWGGMAVHYLSMAVEAWCQSIEEELERALEEIAQDAP